MKERTDLTIDCPLCNKPAKVLEIWKAMAFDGYALRCDECDFSMDIAPKYQGQIKSKALRKAEEQIK